MKIVVLDAGTIPGKTDPFAFLRTLGDVVLYENTKESEVAERIRGAEIVLTNKVPLRAKTLEASDVRFVSVLATGYNVVDVAYAAQKGIVVSNVPSYSADSVAQHTFALLCEIASGVSVHAQAVRAGEWSRSPFFTMKKGKTFELAGKTLGIVGHGEIGKRVERIAEAFGMQTLCFARRPFEGRVPIERLFRESDVISLHCPLNEESFHMIREETLQTMKDGAILINTSRGALVDEAAVTKALKRGKLAYYAADVAESEPPEAKEPFTLSDAIITPHVAWATSEAVDRLLQGTEDNVRAFLRGAPIHVVSG